MDTRLAYDEAKKQKSFYVVDLGVVDHKDFYDLLKDIEVAAKVGIQAQKRVGNCNALAYYVNNVVSINGGPKRVGSFACDISYWITEQCKQDLSELVGFIVNEMWYFDYLDGEGKLMYVTDEVLARAEDLFIERLEARFGCVMGDVKGLPRSRRLDNPTETTSSLTTKV